MRRTVCDARAINDFYIWDWHDLRIGPISDGLPAAFLLDILSINIDQLT